MTTTARPVERGSGLLAAVEPAQAAGRSGAAPIEERWLVVPPGRAWIGFSPDQQLIASTRPLAVPVLVVVGGPLGWTVTHTFCPVQTGPAGATRLLDPPHALAPGDRLVVGRFALRLPERPDQDGGLEARVERARRSSRRNLGRYLLLDELGHGAFSAVHRAWDEQARRLVAVKVLVQLGAPARQRFAREVQLLRRLDHPGIVPVLDHGEHERRPFLVMPLVEGRTLRARVEQDGPLPPKEAAALVKEAARAVEAAHLQDVIHRDLKPENIIIEPGGGPRLLDLGLARSLRDEGPKLTTTGACVGTPLFLAPEQAIGEGDVRSDVYGLGAVLYFALTGRPPLDASSLDRYLDAVARDRPDPPSALRPVGIDAALDAVALHALEREPHRRYTSADALAEDLSRWLSGQPVVAPPPSAAGIRLDQPEVRRLAIAAVVLCALVAAIVAVVALGV